MGPPSSRPVARYVQRKCSNQPPSPVQPNDVRLVNSFGPGAGTPSIRIYHQTNLFDRALFVQSPLFSSTDQWEFGTSIYVIHHHPPPSNPIPSG